MSSTFERRVVDELLETIERQRAQIEALDAECNRRRLEGDEIQRIATEREKTRSAEARIKAEARSLPIHASRVPLSDPAAKAVCGAHVPFAELMIFREDTTCPNCRAVLDLTQAVGK